MGVTVIPTIQQGEVIQISLTFDKPLPLSDFRELLEEIDEHINSLNKSKTYKQRCIRYPVYSNGEMIAVIEKYPNGKTKRTYL